MSWHKIFGAAQNFLGPVKGQGKNRLVLGLVKRSADSQNFVVPSYARTPKLQKEPKCLCLNSCKVVKGSTIKSLIFLNRDDKFKNKSYLLFSGCVWTKCVQKHTYHRLLVYNPSDYYLPFKIESFKIPSSCDCYTAQSHEL